MEKPFHTLTSELKGTGRICKPLHFLQSDSLCFHLSINELKKEFPFIPISKKQSFSHVKLKLSRHLSLGRHEAEHFSFKPNKSIKKIYSFRAVLLQGPWMPVVGLLFSQSKRPFCCFLEGSPLRKEPAVSALLSFLCQGQREEELESHILESGCISLLQLP